MKNLSKNLKLSLDIIKNKFIYKNGMDYSYTNKCYNKVNNIFKNNNCEVYDINNMIQHYKNENYRKIINDLKKLIRSRNKGIIKKAYDSSIWKSFLSKLEKELNEIYIGKVNIKHIEEGVLKVLKKYNNNWIGYWTIINVNKSGDIKDINIFDMNDYNKLKDFLHKKRKYLYKK